MNGRQSDSVKMLEVVVSNQKEQTRKWLILSGLVVVILLLMVNNQPGQGTSLSQRSTSVTKKASAQRSSSVSKSSAVVKAEKLMEGPPIQSAVNAGTLEDVKDPHSALGSLPSGTLPIITSFAEQQPSPPKVRVRLFMESKCPACKMFTSQYVNKVLHADGVGPSQV